MAKTAYLTPSVNISRSKFNISDRHLTTIDHGDLVPVKMIEVLPGDTIEMDISTLTRMGQLIYPIMDNIHQYIWAFFVPTRLVFDKTKEFYGENTDAAGIQPDEITLPTTTQYQENKQITTDKVSLGEYFGVVSYSGDLATHFTPVSCIPMRAYGLIWNTWFRDENFQNPLTIVTDNSSKIYSENGQEKNYMSNPLKVNKMFDFTTSQLPWPQKSNPVTLPVLGEAPILRMGNKDFLAESEILPIANGDKNGIQFSDANGKVISKGLGVGATGKLNGDSSSTGGNSSPIQGTNLTLYTDNFKADLSQAQPVSISELRLAMMTQLFYENDARFGTRFYREFLEAHFNVKGPEIAEIPECLGYAKININIASIYNMTGHEQGQNSKLGEVGATSVTAANNKLFIKSFTEPGIILVLSAFKHDRTYSQGIDPYYLKSRKFDFYFPEFANISDQARTKNEVRFTDKDNGGEDVFGYAPAWEEYRHGRNRASGLMNPARQNSLNYATLTENFATEPTLNAEYLVEDDTNLKRCLAQGNLKGQYMCDFYFRTKAVRPLPTYAIPGFTDKF